MKKLIVIKIGGSTLGNHDTTLEDLVVLQKQNIPIVVVHGGGNKVTEWLKRQNIETSFKNGLRVTDEKSLEVVAAVLGGLVNSDLVSEVNTLGGKAVGMTGVDGNLLEGSIVNPELGYVGKITKVNPEAIQAVLNAGFIPLVAPPCAVSSEETTSAPYVNVNGDDMAGALADALGAEKLIFLTDVEGIRDGEGNLMQKLAKSEIKPLIESGVISKGMIPKTEAAIVALQSAYQVQIIDGRTPHALILAIEGNSSGTFIS